MSADLKPRECWLCFHHGEPKPYISTCEDHALTPLRDGYTWVKMVEVTPMDEQTADDLAWIIRNLEYIAAPLAANETGASRLFALRNFIIDLKAKRAQSKDVAR